MTKPLTSVVHVSLVKRSHIALSFCRFHIAMWHLVAMWTLKFNLSLAHAPRYLIHALCLTASPFTLISVDTHLDSCCLEPTKRNSVLALFLYNWFASIQSLISLMHCSKVCITLHYSSGIGLKVSFIVWSSAKSWRLVGGDTTPSNVDAYALYKMGPATLPWGTENDNVCSVEYTLSTITLHDLRT